MSRKLLLLLCLCNALLFTVGNALSTFVPVYAVRLGADRATTGYLFALVFLSLSLGTIFFGWLSDRLQRRKALLIAAALIDVPIYLLMSATTDYGLLFTLFSLGWFTGSAILVAVLALAGLYAGPSERGKIFGLLASCTAVGQLVAGVFAGQLVDRLGYPVLFTVAAVLSVVIAVLGLLLVDRSVPRHADSKTGGQAALWGNRSFVILFVACILALVAGGMTLLIRPLEMDRLRFDAQSIASVGAIGGLVTLPMPVLIGWLSDRLPRKYLLLCCFTFALLGLLTLAGAMSLAQFWLSGVFISVASTSTAIGSAMVTDFVPTDVLGTGVSWINATGWIGFTVGLAATGQAMQALGVTNTLLLGSAMVIAALVLAVVLPIRSQGRATEDVVSEIF
jgi:MFS family permease